MLGACGCAAQPADNYETTLDGSKIIFFKTDNDADCALISSNGSSILIDTGEKKDAYGIIKHLNRYGIYNLDMIVFSHFDKDHCGGAIKILEKITVEKIVHPEYIKNSKETTKLFALVEEMNIDDNTISCEDEWQIGDIKLNLYPPEKESYAVKQSNNSSLVVMAEVQGVKALFTGDCQESRIEELLNSDADFNADILKLMYHGREVKNEAELLDRINPEYTIITAESDKKKVRQNIETLGDKTGTCYYTCDDNVIFSIDNGSITAEVI